MRALLISMVAGVCVLAGCQHVQNDRIATTGVGLGALTGSAVAGADDMLLDRKEARLRQELTGSGVSVSRDPDGAIQLVMPAATFASSSATIQPPFQTALDHIARVLNEGNSTGQLRLVIHGHTDRSGNDSINIPLSHSRARAVVAYLAAQGVPSQHMMAQGYGSGAPIADNATASGRERNRRVEITVSVVRS
ncbi:OmpA family protein [Acinetobacter sp. WZC-1]|uniref:OmpA family protein n=1 Tax=Acinetobacter sp. WZC-1 TaxID=3459034 RepID=UPI00403D97DE